MTTRWAMLACVGLVACARGGRDGASEPDAATDPCADAGTPPTTIACTGLYADVASKAIAPGVRPYEPAVSFWVDAAEKTRWIEIPDGGVIDDTDPNSWVFPVGTKAWKEMRREGRRIETRMFQKVRSDEWVHATYLWSADGASATRSFGADVPLPSGETHHVPTPSECDRCHRGRADRLLGFDAVLLGLQGASGVTLADLAREGTLVPAPALTSLVIGDDGTSLNAPPLAWLHANCGVTCHNANPDAEGYGVGMHLRLDPTTLDGRRTNGVDPELTTIGVPAISPSWSGTPRIAPGEPDESLLFQLVSHRGDGEQMPPLATDYVDAVDVAAIRSWIAAMPSR